MEFSKTSNATILEQLGKAALVINKSGIKQKGK